METARFQCKEILDEINFVYTWEKSEFRFTRIAGYEFLTSGGSLSEVSASS